MNERVYAALWENRMHVRDLDQLLGITPGTIGRILKRPLPKEEQERYIGIIKRSAIMREEDRKIDKGLQCDPGGGTGD